MSQLVNGFLYSVTTRDATAFYSLSARPLFVPFATEWRYGMPPDTSRTGRHRRPPVPEPSRAGRSRFEATRTPSDNPIGEVCPAASSTK